MSASSQSASKLYTPRMLMLSAKLADYPLNPAFPFIASSRSKTCGSTMEIALDVDAHGCVSKVGMQVTACAVGQSSAAIMAEAIVGAGLVHLRNTQATIQSWLEDGGAPPDWPGFETMLPVREHTGRHGALLLPWNAAIEALSSAAGTS